MGQQRTAGLFPLRRLVGVALALALAGCSREAAEVEAPVRATDAAPTPTDLSILTVPIDADQRAIVRAVEQSLPRTLWTINRPMPRCIAPQRLKVFGKTLNVTPPISCTIVGTVTRGAIRLRGEGRDIVADVPLNAQISARDVGGILKGETATGSAMAHARIRLDLAPDWTARGTVRLRYDWTSPPGIDFLGQRITFTDQADAKLQPVIRDLERNLPRELAKLDLRSKVEPFWRQSFATLELNAKNPPVWMRVTPQRILFAGYVLQGRRLRLDLGMEALTQTFVGPRPDAPTPTALPVLVKAKTDGRFRLSIPVVADYAQLEPVILKALVKRSRRPFILPGLGPVNARFDKVTAYGTQGGRIAIGLTLAVTSPSGAFGETHGKIWLTARPVNAPGSARVGFEGLAVTGDVDRTGGDMLVQLGNSPGVSSLVAGSLTQNFAGDLAKLLVKVRRAIAERRQGDFLIRATITGVETGRIAAYGQGLFLPVQASGKAAVSYRPR